jgi:hypothetical protein
MSINNHKNVWTIKSTRCHRILHFTSTRYVSYTQNHSKYSSFNIINTSLYHFRVGGLRLSYYRMFISLVNLFVFFVDTNIFYEFNCILMIIHIKKLIKHK